MQTIATDGPTTRPTREGLQLVYGHGDIRRIFVVSFPALGDALLTTPLITGLRRAYPDAEIHVLVRHGVQQVFDGNPDIDHVLTMTRRPPLSEGIPFVRGIYRKYDIAVSSSYVDRAILHCVAAAPRRASLIPAVNSAFGQNRWWKKRLVQHWESFDEGKHFLQQSAELLAQLGIEQDFRLTPPTAPGSHSKLTELLGGGWEKTGTVVFQTSAGQENKRWTLSGWAAAARHYYEQGHRLVYVGGPSAEEKQYINTIISQSGKPGDNIAGLTSLADASCLLQHAALYIGVDTCNSHIAAASGAPTVVLFGPTNPCKWAPFPINGTNDPTPFPASGSRTIGNVGVVRSEPGQSSSTGDQPAGDYVDSTRCLSDLAVDSVLEISDSLLDAGRLAAG